MLYLNLTPCLHTKSGLFQPYAALAYRRLDGGSAGAQAYHYKVLRFENLRLSAYWLGTQKISMDSEFLLIDYRLKDAM